MTVLALGKNISPTGCLVKRFSAIFLCVLSFLALSLFLSPTAEADRPVPPADPARGLVFDGLEFAKDGKCKGGMEIQVPGNPGKVFCTHGPDAPISTVPSLSPAKKSPTFTAACDGDGITGNRVQVLYAHASDVPSRYATQLASFQQWAIEVDSIFRESAATTGGFRRVRFVTDKNCNPIVTPVTLTPTGDDSFGRTIGELLAQGYNRTDRKYLVFTDARRYCGIANIEFDDQPGQANANNLGPHFARVDAGCWSGVIAAHELMHTLGGVQLTAPNSDGNFHCTDGYDNMCNYSGQTVAIVCPDQSGLSQFDCGRQDYYNANPAAGSYLDTHWNVANSQFLIRATGSEPAVKLFIPLITVIR